MTQRTTNSPIKVFDISRYRIDGDWSIGIELRVNDMHDSCGQWLSFSAEFIHWGFSIERYLGPTRENWDDSHHEAEA